MAPPPAAHVTPHVCTRETCAKSGFIALADGVVVCRASGTVHVCTQRQCQWGRLADAGGGTGSATGAERACVCWATGRRVATGGCRTATTTDLPPIATETAQERRATDFLLRAAADTTADDRASMLEERRLHRVESVGDGAVAAGAPEGGCMLTGGVGVDGGGRGGGVPSVGAGRDDTMADIAAEGHEARRRKRDRKEGWGDDDDDDGDGDGDGDGGRRLRRAASCGGEGGGDASAGLSTAGGACVPSPG